MTSTAERTWSIQRWVFWLSVAILAGAAVIYLLVWLGPDVIARHDIGNVTGPPRILRLQQARDTARGRLLTLGTGLFAAGALLFTGRNYGLARRTYLLTQAGQVTDRYTKAIDQLGSDKLDVRIGGIYALERIARDSAPDHPTVVEVLAAFIRDHSREPWPPSATDQPEPGQRGNGGARRLRVRLAHTARGQVGTRADPPAHTTRPDVQAALTVIGRRDTRRDQQPIDLAGADLTDANFTNAHLSHAILNYTTLTNANLTNAQLNHAFLASTNLTNANLTNAQLNHAFLGSANLTRANLEGADLTEAGLFWEVVAIEARLNRATLTHTKLLSANLTRAKFFEADLTGAWLSGAVLTEADFTNANLSGTLFNMADLTGACFTRKHFTKVNLAGTDFTSAVLKDVDWPMEKPAPEGWVQGPGSGKLSQAHTDGDDSSH